MEYHITEEGTEIKLVDLELSHLKNIIGYIEKKSVEGLKVCSGGGFDANDIYYDEDTY